MSARIQMIWKERFQQHNAHMYEFFDEYPSRDGTQYQRQWIALVDGEDIGSLVWKDFDLHPCHHPPKGLHWRCHDRQHRIDWFQGKFRGIVEGLRSEGGAFVLDEATPRS